MIDLTNGVCFRHGKLSANMARAFAIAAALAVAMTGRTAIAAATLEHALYGTTQDRQALDIFTITNEHGLRVRFLSLGGVITEIDVPDGTGRLDKRNPRYPHQ
jgi:aldose 1-epimerase